MLKELTTLPMHLEIVLILTVGSTLATIFGYLTEKLKMSPILGYLMAGYFIGPYFPGFVADAELSEQLAEIGVILMMFWVGLHLKWQELTLVKHVSISGAIGQTFFSTLIGAIIVKSVGWSLEAALVIGLSIGIASTVVLMRVLTDNNCQNTKSGHISISWLICEDFIAIFFLLLLPTIAHIKDGQAIFWRDLLFYIFLVIIKFTILTTFLFTLGRKVILFILNKVIKTRTKELFSLATLAIIFAVTVMSAALTGTSIALGAFIGGMVIGQTSLHHQISDNLKPLRDAFVVFFFLSIGMLFNPLAVAKNFILFLSILGVILFVKPLVAWIIARLWKLSNEISIAVAVALAQVGEFSFILAEEASKFDILPDGGYDIIVACAFISLAINPLLFKSINYQYSKALSY